MKDAFDQWWEWANKDRKPITGPFLLRCRRRKSVRTARSSTRRYAWDAPEQAHRQRGSIRRADGDGIKRLHSVKRRI